MGSMPAAYIDAIHDAASEPWLTQPIDEDRQKHLATLAALPNAKYRHGLEVGCGTGALTQHLAERCDRLLGIDLAQAALVRANARLKGKRHVRLACRAFPGELQADTPTDGFDLVVMSGVLYHLDAQAIARAARVTRAITAPGGHVQLVNWLASSDGLPVTGNEAAELFIAALRPVAPVLLQLRTADYRIDLLQL